MSPIDDNPGLILEFTSSFRQWRSKLKDVQAKSRIAARLDRLEEGHWGDVKAVGGGVIELRIHAGPGYRMYLAKRGDRVVILLCGGDKDSQGRDIAVAQAMVREFDDGA
ncbi:type II toxin-antitoxin system RelE/ParE family toxin [Brevundimonas sp.]|uniref:type II toxin-antitoxin system RelE/ParE family toxin n=1 Tax=Brevundimonas sp. TaxID=1871086 RepID=UPI001A1F2487|nr:type II toxin-antitoxin system RelE/ParE family toxin [Brevundimonas sp.]MBJ7486528.1 type II toxin-antitoxin system RelE/ParE family toxin [Brevundimonas sp.]